MYCFTRVQHPQKSSHQHSEGRRMDTPPLCFVGEAPGHCTAINESHIVRKRTLAPNDAEMNGKIEKYSLIKMRNLRMSVQMSDSFLTLKYPKCETALLGSHA